MTAGLEGFRVESQPRQTAQARTGPPAGRAAARRPADLSHQARLRGYVMKSIMRESAFACVVVALLAGVVLADDKKPVKKPEGGKGPVIVLQIDGSKLSPDVLKQLIQAAGGDVKKPDGGKKPGEKKPDGSKALKPGEGNKPTKKPDGDKQPGGDKKPDGDLKPGDKKSISLADAIGVAEKHVQGTAIKAEATGGVFVVEVKASKGVATVKVDQGGNVLGQTGDKKPDGDKKPGTGNK
jgi:hypothetical protein